MIRPIETPADLPGQTPVTWRRESWAVFAAAVAGACWPPLILTLPLWPPLNWRPALDMDWRLMVLVLGLIMVPTGIWLIARERARTGRPVGRLGVVWRFMLYGGVLAAAVETLLALVTMVLGWFEAGSFMQALGASETTLLILGVGGLPVAILVGVSYALWAGLCVAFIAFKRQPPRVRDRLGLMDGPAA